MIEILEIRTASETEHSSGAKSIRRFILSVLATLTDCVADAQRTLLVASGRMTHYSRRADILRHRKRSRK